VVTGAGGAAATGGTGGTTTAGRVRTVSSFDDGWLFVRGDPAGADQTTFADTSGRALSVPHDWSIEGLFDQNAPTLGNGGYLPAGVGWYRKGSRVQPLVPIDTSPRQTSAIRPPPSSTPAMPSHPPGPLTVPRPPTKMELPSAYAAPRSSSDRRTRN